MARFFTAAAYSLAPTSVFAFLYYYFNNIQDRGNLRKKELILAYNSRRIKVHHGKLEAQHQVADKLTGAKS